MRLAEGSKVVGVCRAEKEDEEEETEALPVTEGEAAEDTGLDMEIPETAPETKPEEPEI